MIVFVLAVSFLLKAGVRLWLSRELNYWETGYSLYYELAQNFLREGTLYLRGYHGLDPGNPLYALRPPLYPLFIAFIAGLTSSSAPIFILIQSFISTLAVFFVYRIARTVSGVVSGLASALLYAFYPYSFFHDTQLQETGFYSCLVLASV